ncbi:hypothetical protein PRO82_000750 [Candidatus Protochlamydia amoebophila]|nr:hypothetical protein [Candidatus Protochlamydia amoebophila]
MKLKGSSIILLSYLFQKKSENLSEFHYNFLFVATAFIIKLELVILQN